MIDGDRDLLRQMRNAGTDMSRSREVGHFCIFPTEARAAAASAEATRQDPTLSAEVYETDRWVLRAWHSVPLSEDYIAQMRPWFTALAQRHGGVYDGWDADADAEPSIFDRIRMALRRRSD